MTKFKTKVLAVLMGVFVLSMLFLPVQAKASTGVPISPYWQALATHGSANTINGSSGKISISADTYTSKYTVKISATLQRMDRYGNWSNVTSWTATGAWGAAGLSQTYTAVSGYLYKASYTVYVYNGNTFVESASGVTNSVSK